MHKSNPSSLVPIVIMALSILLFSIFTKSTFAAAGEGESYAITVAKDMASNTPPTPTVGNDIVADDGASSRTSSAPPSSAPSAPTSSATPADGGGADDDVVADDGSSLPTGKGDGSSTPIGKGDGASDGASSRTSSAPSAPTSSATPADGGGADDVVADDGSSLPTGKGDGSSTPIGKGDGASDGADDGSSAPTKVDDGADDDAYAPSPSPSPSPCSNVPKAHLVYTKTCACSDDPESYYLKILSTVFGCEEKAKEALAYSYKSAASGFIAMITIEQAKQLQKQPEVLQIDDTYNDVQKGRYLPTI